MHAQHCELDIAYLRSSQQALPANSRAGQNFIALKEGFLVISVCLHPHVSQVSLALGVSPTTRMLYKPGQLVLTGCITLGAGGRGKKRKIIT